MLVSAFDSSKADLLKDAEDAAEITAAARVIDILAEALRGAARADSGSGTLILEPTDSPRKPAVVARAAAGLNDLGMWLPAVGGGVRHHSDVRAINSGYGAEGVVRQISEAL